VRDSPTTERLRRRVDEAGYRDRLVRTQLAELEIEAP
jgi:hypothetical protein